MWKNFWKNRILHAFIPRGVTVSQQSIPSFELIALVLQEREEAAGAIIIIGVYIKLLEERD